MAQDLKNKIPCSHVCAEVRSLFPLSTVVCRTEHRYAQALLHPPSPCWSKLHTLSRFPPLRLVFQNRVSL